MPGRYILDEIEYKLILRRAEVFLHEDARDFERPLKNLFKERRYVGFHQFSLPEEFGGSVKELSSEAKDREVYFLNLDCGDSGGFGFVLQDNWTILEYESFLSPDADPKSDPLLFFTAVRFLIFGNSRKWMFYGDRDFEIIFGGLVTGGCDEMDHWPPMLRMPWIPESVAKDIILGSTDDEELYQNRAQNLVRNFGLLNVTEN